MFHVGPAPTDPSRSAADWAGRARGARLAVAVVDAEACPRVVPLDGARRAHDVAGAALDAVLVRELHAAVDELEALGRAGVDAHLVRAGVAHVGVDGDVLELVRVGDELRGAEAGLDVHDGDRGQRALGAVGRRDVAVADRKSTRLNSSHGYISY